MSEGLATALSAARPVARLMAEAGYRLYLVGGVTRDVLRGTPFFGCDTHTTDTGDTDTGDIGSIDLDCTTNARPSDVLRIVGPVASAVWTQGRRFGTIGCVVDGQTFEITTHRADRYDLASRKPAVVFGTDVVEDLYRRDFTVNAMAVDTADGRLVDPCYGQRDLSAGLLRTPLDPEISFGEDPLRMLRAARFISRYHLEPDPALIQAVVAMGDRLAIVSSERIRDELQKLLLLHNPIAGLCFLVRTGLLAQILPESPHLDDTVSDDAANSSNDCCDYSARVVDDTCLLGRIVSCVEPVPGQRWAALLVGIPVPIAVQRLRALRISGDLIKTIKGFLLELELLRSAPRDVPNVRRLVHGCPIDIDSAVSFARSVVVAVGESTTSIDRFVTMLTDLREHEDLARLNSPLTGTQVMDVLGVESGPRVGQALSFLQELTFERGPISSQTARRALLRWSTGQ